jgi:hypothetical protein
MVHYLNSDAEPPLYRAATEAHRLIEIFPVGHQLVAEMLFKKLKNVGEHNFK